MAASPKEPAREDDVELDPVWGAEPTPEQRADMVVRNLEQFIRDGKTVSGGMSFRKWQDMARGEIASAIRDARKGPAGDELFIERAALALGAGFSTIGVWGVALAIDAAPSRVFAAIAILAAGLACLWYAGVLGFRKPMQRRRLRRRKEALSRVQSLDKELKQLETYLERRKKMLEKKSRENE